MNMTAIEHVTAWEALDSRGRPTVTSEVVLRGGARGCAAVPSGASTGRHEAHELRDGGDRYGGWGVRTAVANATGVLADAVHGLDALDQTAVDRRMCELDGTEALSRLGANAILAVSLASLLAGANARALPLYRAVSEDQAAPLIPLPMVNIMSGGAHAGAAIDVQDFLVVPVAARSFAQAIEWAAAVRAGTAGELRRRGLPVALVADEGGLGPVLPSNRAALEAVVAGITAAGLRPGDDVAIAIDVAATQLVDVEGGYTLARENRRLTARDLVEELRGWSSEFPIVSIEDPLAEDDWSGWAVATELLGGLQLLGDDLFTTNPARLRRGIEEGIANAVLVKPNQIGTVERARAVVDLAQTAGYATVLSARSGETEDSWLADLAVGWRTGQIKVGSTTRAERTAKWNRLLRIEAELGPAAEFAGGEVVVGTRSVTPT